MHAPPLVRGLTLTALVAGLLAVPRPASAAAAAPSACVPGAPGVTGPFYPGPSASPDYDATFTRGAPIPHLSTHTPQGMTLWRNWNSRGDDLLVMGAYRDNKDSYLVGINAETDKHVGTLRVDESHLGGVGLVGDWLFTTHREGRTVRRYQVDDLRSAMKKAARTGGKVRVDHRGTQKLIGGHFMGVHDGRLWAGTYSYDDDKARMAQYTLGSRGKLKQVGAPWQVPTQTQGVLVTANRFVFYSGLLAGRITVVERGPRTLADARGRCFGAPQFGQALVADGGRVHLNFEGGAASQDKPRNVNPIRHLHRAPLAVLSELPG